MRTAFRPRRSCLTPTIPGRACCAKRIEPDSCTFLDSGAKLVLFLAEPASLAQTTKDNQVADKEKGRQPPHHAPAKELPKDLA